MCYIIILKIKVIRTWVLESFAEWRRSRKYFNAIQKSWTFWEINLASILHCFPTLKDKTIFLATPGIKKCYQVFQTIVGSFSSKILGIKRIFTGFFLDSNRLKLENHKNHMNCMIKNTLWFYKIQLKLEWSYDMIPKLESQCKTFACLGKNDRSHKMFTGFFSLWTVQSFQSIIIMWSIYRTIVYGKMVRDMVQMR